MRTICVPRSVTQPQLSAVLFQVNSLWKKNLYFLSIHFLKKSEVDPLGKVSAVTTNIKLYGQEWMSLSPPLPPTTPPYSLPPSTSSSHSHFPHSNPHGHTHTTHTHTYPLPLSHSSLSLSLSPPSLRLVLHWHFAIFWMLEIIKLDRNGVLEVVLHNSCTTFRTLRLSRGLKFFCCCK